MKLAIKLLCVLFICGSSLGYAQFSDPIIINNSNRSIYNPAFAGIEEGTSLGYRSSMRQHPIYSNYIFNNGFDLNGKSNKLNSGYGANISHNSEHTSTKDNPYYSSDPEYNHHTRKHQNLFIKFNYNYQLNLGEASLLTLGTSTGISLTTSKTVYENSNEKVYNSPNPIFTFGMRYQYKNFFIGSSAGSIPTMEIDPFNYGIYLYINTGFNWEVSKSFIIEPSLSLNYGIIQYRILRSNFIFFKKYNLGGGYYDRFDNLRGPNNGFHVFAGVKFKEKLGLNLAYQRNTSHFSFDESQDFWLNKHGLELNVNYVFN